MSHHVLIGLWSAVILGAVLGRILEDRAPSEIPEEVYSSHPEIEREQLAAWGEEFFQRQRSFPSRTQVLEEHDSRSIRLDGNRRHYQIDSPQVKEESLEWMLRNVFMYPRNHNTNETAKDAAKKYIVDHFQVTSRLQTALQNFQPIQFLNIYEGTTIPSGTNIIGVLKGTRHGTPEDKPVLVGAHYDTVTFSPGTDDNGSGTAAMLEAARAIATSSCSPRNTIFFVAFDLEEVGSQGSLIFIKDYLAQVLGREGLKRFQGAFILDTIMNFNDTTDSQTFPTDWSIVLPDVYDVVADNFYKGDFLSMIYRKGVDSRLADNFMKHWEADKYKLLPFPLSLGKDLPSMELLADHINFLRSDHSRFWYMNDSAVSDSLQAVLMTDTGPYRGNMRSCYHTVCDGPEISVLNNPENLKFLTKITNTLVKTLMEMGECGEEDGKRKPGNSNHSFIKTQRVHAKSGGGTVGASPIRNLLNFVRWMELSPS